MSKQNLDCSANLKYCVNKPQRFSKINIFIDHQLYKPITKANDEYNYFRNDWATLAFRAFKILAKKKIYIGKVCIIGTGSGLDGIGALEILNPKELLITDISEEIAHKAYNNIKRNLLSAYENITYCESTFFSNDIFNNGKKFDLIYENLPNLPDELKTHSDQPINASFLYNFDVYKNSVPEKYNNYLLTSHYTFLQQAKNYLSNKGIVLCCIGGRFDYEIIREMFDSIGYDPKIILYDIKLQNEADTNLPSYASWETILQKEHNDTFRFYEYKKLLEYFESLNGENKRLKGYKKYSGWLDKKDYLKEYLNKNCLTADIANQRFIEGKKIAQEVYIIAGKLK